MRNWPSGQRHLAWLKTETTLCNAALRRASRPRRTKVLSSQPAASCPGCQLASGNGVRDLYRPPRGATSGATGCRAARRCVRLTLSAGASGHRPISGEKAEPESSLAPRGAGGPGLRRAGSRRAGTSCTPRAVRHSGFPGTIPGTQARPAAAANISSRVRIGAGAGPGCRDGRCSPPWQGVAGSFGRERDVADPGAVDGVGEAARARVGVACGVDAHQLPRAGVRVEGAAGSHVDAGVFGGGGEPSGRALPQSVAGPAGGVGDVGSVRLGAGRVTARRGPGTGTAGGLTCCSAPPPWLGPPAMRPQQPCSASPGAGIPVAGEVLTALAEARGELIVPGLRQRSARAAINCSSGISPADAAPVARQIGRAHGVSSPTGGTSAGIGRPGIESGEVQ
jgi:hypothetical protein